MVPSSALTTSKHRRARIHDALQPLPSAQINGAAAPGYSSDQATRRSRRSSPRRCRGRWASTTSGCRSRREGQEGHSPGGIYGLSLLFVFLILAALYESWSLPFSVLLGVPVAVFGAYATLSLRQMENNVFAQIGLIMLIGLSAKNAILIVEFAKAEYEKGKGTWTPPSPGARLRLRPILMTSFAFILGCVPLWIAGGSGAVRAACWERWSSAECSRLLMRSS